MIAATEARTLTRALRTGLQTMGVLWLVLGIVIASGMMPIGIDGVAARFVVGVLLACDGGAFALAGRWYRPHVQMAAMFAVGLVALNLALTLLDDLGTADFVALGILGSLLILLLTDISRASK